VSRGALAFLFNAILATGLAHGNLRPSATHILKTSTADTLGVVAVTAYVYHANGNVTAVTDPDGNATQHVYDANNRKTSTSDALARITRFAYDKVGNKVQEINARGGAKNWAYDALNRVSIAQDPERNQTLYDYDKVGNRVGETWPNGNHLTHVYDALNRPTSSTDTLGSLGAKGYDGQGNVLSETDPRGNVSSHLYDELNRRSESRLPSAAGTRLLAFGYDLVNLYYNRARWMDARIDRFVSMDPQPGMPGNPISLSRYLYANADGVNKIDPSGFSPLDETVTAQGIEINLAVASIRSGFQISAAQGGAALRALGEAVEIAGKQVLGKALRIDPRFIRNIPVNGPGGRRVLDFFLKIGNRVATVEAKYKLPSAGSQAFVRLVGQLESGMATPQAGQIVLWTLKAPTEAELAALLVAVPEAGSTVQFVNGLIGLANWSRLFFLGL
jgi:RHS repeat-associated protein